VTPRHTHRDILACRWCHHNDPDAGIIDDLGT
jgi:hypothetical protein